MPRFLSVFLNFLVCLPVFAALLACSQQNPVFIGSWRCAELELQLSGDGRFQWEDAQGQVWRGRYRIVQEGRVFRIHHTPNQWPTEVGAYIPTGYPVDGFYLSATASTSDADRLTCQRKHTRGTGRLWVWLGKEE